MEVDFSSYDGVRLFGTLELPKTKPSALILLVHGITSDRSEWGIFDLAAELFAREGFASLRFDFRGHGESALASKKISLLGIQQDILAAWSELLPFGPDAKHFVIGSSFGGGLSYRAADLVGGFSRAFLLAPVFDYAADIMKSAPNWEQATREGTLIQYSNLQLNPEIISESGGFRSLLEGSKLPATIFHGDQDDDVPIESSQHVVDSHPDFELVAVRGAGHVMSVPGDFDMEDSQSWEFVNDVLTTIINTIRSSL